MATEYDIGEPIRFTVTFRDSTSTLADPTTVELDVTDPSGTVTAYTFGGGTVTKDSTGVYHVDVTAGAGLWGTWFGKWTGTGTVAVVEEQIVVVRRPRGITATDVLTLDEAKRAVNLAPTSTTDDEDLALYVSAVSARLDALCGPIVQRTVTGELHDGGDFVIHLRFRPVASVTSATEYNATTAQVLAIESNTTKTANDVLLQDAGAKFPCALYRRSNNATGLYAYGLQNVSVTYVAGRSATTAAVSAKFKKAAGMMLAHLWRREQGAGTSTFGYSAPSGPGPALPGFAVPNAVVEIIADELLPITVG